jgi:hypothetical protein
MRDAGIGADLFEWIRKSVGSRGAEYNQRRTWIAMTWANGR